mmetsp:Transcript_43408/g.41868  ORF Transcript_43408/g.41868 Transcript_43408/m.41868 type:complete len:108 (-) Transcript_43408:1624-1947(-)
MKASGGGSEQPITICEKIVEQVAKYQDKVMYMQERNGTIIRYSWKNMYDDSMAFAKACHFVGAGERKAVNIIGNNSPEWAITSFGTILGNQILSGVYITNAPEACLY